MYNARVRTPLAAEVEALCFVDEDAMTKLELLCGNTPAVIIGLNELPVDATSDTACELEYLDASATGEPLMTEEMVVTVSAVLDVGEDATTDTTGKPRVLVRILPPAVYVQVPVTVKSVAELKPRVLSMLDAAVIVGTAGVFSMPD